MTKDQRIHALCKELEKALAELDAAKAENARLAASLQRCREDVHELFLQDKFSHEARNWLVQFERQLNTQDSTALRELLGPTVKILQWADNYAAGAGYINRAEVKQELARLRAVMGEKV